MYESMAATAGTAGTATTMRRLLISFSIAILFWVHLQCHYFLSDACQTGDVLSTLDVESRNDWRRSKSGALAENLGVLNAGASSSRKSRTGSMPRRTLMSYQGLNTTKRLELEALITFKAAITDDPMGILNSWRSNDTDSCGWAGVVCSAHYPQHLIDLNLDGGGLVGNLESALQELGNLPFLKRLDLSDNVFTGSIPGASLANCSNLLYLNLSINHLTGAIPSQLGELANLETLDFEGNNLTGPIPLSLSNCTLLRVLDLGSNFLQGDIPSVLGRLSNLEILNLGSTTPMVYRFRPLGTNSFSGSLPPALGNCSSLTHLSLALNSNLEGEFPPELSQLKRLQVISLPFCSFKGTVPAWLGNFTALSVLFMSGNLFHGDIPDELGRLTDLRFLFVDRNNLTGVIPFSITNCTSLLAVRVAMNNLTGPIPLQLGLLTSLQSLTMEENSFTGVLPSSIANCSHLEILSLGQNPFDAQIIPFWLGSLTNLFDLELNTMHLEGKIPEEIGRLSNLEFLLLYSNDLTGLIPPSLGNCTLMTQIYLEDNRLTGEIPAEVGLMTNLTRMFLSENFLSGSFPKFIANLTQIVILEISLNSFSGTLSVDGDFGRLSQLQLFDAFANSFSGPFPETLSNCSKLLSLTLASNNLTGGIPPSLGNLTRLEGLIVGYNPFKGTIPVEVFSCTRLGELDFSSSELDGSIPPGIGQLSSLLYLYLEINNFTGAIPTSLGNCSDMRFLDLSYNQFLGNVPGSIFASMSDSLASLNLSNNLFSGFWPSQLGTLTSLQVIILSSNNMSGSIPNSVGNLKALVVLDISNNSFTGAIPPSLGVLPELAFFNASYNSFLGPIPHSGDFKKVNLTNSSFLGNPGLCGTLLGLDRECPAAPSPSGSSRNVTSGKSKCDSKGFNCRKSWIPTVCAVVGFLCIAATVLCWMNTLSTAAKRRSDNKHLMLNFGSHIIISETDVLRAMDRDGDNVIGVGSTSVVYRGVLPGGEMFAVKVLPSNGEYGHDERDEDGNSQREKELLHEVYILSQLRHRNILKVLSFCSTLDVKAMILEYMPQGSLHEHLYPIATGGFPTGVCKLTWQTRFNIAVGVAEGMMYLHHNFPEPLIHRDLKPSNILLDAELDPKVGDFGLSKFANPIRAGEATASAIWGTIGYMPPEYATGTSVSTKGDVYSYGIVLLELLTGKAPTSQDSFGQNGDFRRWVMELFQQTSMELLDPTLMHEGSEDSTKKEQMMLLIRAALFCTTETPQGRPSMSDVVAMLTQIKEVGLVPVTLKTIEDLVNDTCIWASQDPGDANLPSF